MIRSVAEHNKQLCFFTCVRSSFSAAAAVHSWGFLHFFFTCFWRWRWYEDVPVFSFMALPFLAACQMENRHRSSRAIHLVWRVDVGESSIHVIAPCQKCEKLTGQLKNRFTIRGEEVWISRDTSDTCSPRGSTENWEISACPLYFSFRRRENSFLNWVQTLWQRNDLVCHQLLRESLIKVQFGCPIVARIRKISRTLEPLSRIFLQSWLI